MKNKKISLVNKASNSTDCNDTPDYEGMAAEDRLLSAGRNTNCLTEPCVFPTGISHLSNTERAQHALQ